MKTWRCNKSLQRKGRRSPSKSVQVKHDKVKRLGGRCKNMGNDLKEEEAAVANLREKTELDASVADLNEARTATPKQGRRRKGLKGKQRLHVWHSRCLRPHRAKHTGRQISAARKKKQ